LCNNGSGIQIGPFGAQLHQYDYIDSGIPVVMPANMVDEKIDVTEIAQISEQKAQELATHRVKSGDILLPRRGELDRRAYVQGENEGWLCGTGSIRIRVDGSVSSKAVFHSLASPHSVRWIIGNAVGTTMLNLNSKIVGRIPVALPDENHQEIVVELLDDIDGQIKTLTKRVNDTQRIKAVLLHTVSGGVE
jgi:type I restriction enzyme S subunit